MLIDGKSFFDVPVKNKEETYEKKIMSISKNSDYATGNLLDYEYFSKHYKLIAIDLSKHIELENPNLKQHINFIGQLEDSTATMFYYHWEIRRKNSWIFTKLCEYHIKWKHKRS